MRVVRFDDREKFPATVMPFLLEREAENCLLVGMVASADLKPDVLLLALQDEETAEIAGVALKWPGRHVVITDTPPSAVDALVDYFIAEKIPAQGVQSRGDVARRFVDRYASRAGVTPGATTAMALHDLTRVIKVHGVAGAMRTAIAADVDLVAGWVEAFCRDCSLPPPKDGERVHALQRIERGETFLWEVDGLPVSTACLMGPTPNGIRISLVYTPPHLRGRGYASACVAALSQRVLDGGKQFCFLYTDLANSTSNKIYRAVGYEPVCDCLQVLFDEANRAEH